MLWTAGAAAAGALAVGVSKIEGRRERRMLEAVPLAVGAVPGLGHTSIIKVRGSSEAAYSPDFANTRASRAGGPVPVSEATVLRTPTLKRRMRDAP